MSTIGTHQFDSAILKRRRKVRVFLPSEYAANPAKRFRFLIQQDAQMAFTVRDAELPYGSWGIDEWIGKLATEGVIDPPIVVAVDNSPSRMREYFPLSDEFKLYERFVLEELLPWIHANHRVLDGPENASLMGSSMGGLVSFALALNHQGFFGSAACLSPWFEVENNQYVHDVLKKVQKKPALRIYLDSGIRDWRDLDDGHRGMLLARKELLRLGFREGDDLQVIVDTWFPTMGDFTNSSVKDDKREAALTNQHNEFQWRRRMRAPLEFLFRKQ
ncbi:hypothetical protein IT570_11605 [Candidatus Sumerlaeota bacterium]|nr:hypothetical protein [Candidatus Sumerlaeota bacterium]